MNFANALKHYAEASQEPTTQPAHFTTILPSTTVLIVPTLTI